MKSAPLMKERERLQQVMMKTFQEEVQILDRQLQLILMDDLVTAFYNRLHIMKKIQNKK